VEGLPAGEGDRAELSELAFAGAGSGGFAIDEYQIPQVHVHVEDSPRRVQGADAPSWSPRRDRTAPRRSASAVDRHLGQPRAAISVRGGILCKVVKNPTQAAFSSAPDAVATALEAERVVPAESWPADTGLVRVRLAPRAGDAVPRAGDY
jgi:hypothetical protein